MRRGQGWIRRYWQGLLIAAAVSYGQLQDTADTDVVAAQGISFVWMLPEQPRGFHEGEVVGHRILTIPLEIDPDPSPN